MGRGSHGVVVHVHGGESLRACGEAKCLLRVRMCHVCASRSHTSSLVESRACLSTPPSA